ncbi:MFS transporter [Paraconexibacter antarcticus]|uniref:MFS transporter n=1 Tax=Paraconexibacter antarcticus TaxID=2949664 RepID=A0ABY5DNB6_9ACTN|nr:MFS transporter [Paraconexibacter antarcticus]UTI62668.1 MFS transporter [Paraconexibacter antarcticus]
MAHGDRDSSRRRFRRLWAAYAVSTFGTWVAFDAFPLIAILVLHAGPGAVAALAAVGLAAGAVAALPLGPWIEFRSKRGVMVAMDLVRFCALMSVPAAYALGRLTFGQLVAVSVLVSTADIAFKAASGACLKGLVAPGDLLAASARLESTAWTATAVGPPLGGAAIGVLGPMTTVVANGVSFLLSAAGVRSIGGDEAIPARPADARRMRAGDLLAGWRVILGHPALRSLFLNTVLVNGLILASAPLLAVLMLGRLGFAPWEYGLAFGAPCVGGLVGSRLAGRCVARFGRDRVLRAAGTLRACWPLGLAFVPAGPAGLALVLVLQFGLVTCVGVFNPVFAAYRLEQTPADRVARTLSAWSVTSGLTVAGLTAIWGLLATVAGPRAAIAAAGVLLLATPLLLPRRHVFADDRRAAPVPVT